MTTSPLANPSATREILEAFGLATKHRLGQNFLIDNHVIERIMDLAELTGSERVLEVGPGIGTLTLALVQAAGRVTSIEMDSELEPVLSAHAIDHPNFNFIMGDALAVPPAQIAEALGGESELLVANLPYNVAATIILQFFQTMPSLRRAVVMVQKEVADRIAAVAGTKVYGAYTVKLSLYGEVTGRFEVPPRCFMPAPHVDSAVVRIDRVGFPGTLSDRRVDAACGTDAPVSTAGSDGVLTCDSNGGQDGASVLVLAGAPSAEDIARVVDAAFAQRRKTIRNSMSANGFDKAALDAAFAQCDIASTARAETLSTIEFVQLAAALAAASALS
ncbi:16S rRNA (adenine(1518)-N(6)/adenine(1519)-N(6))-dimethyltransferase RsmA [Collinsella stercoris]|uniref:Ribosomal RNA small subunit methyltransferase A n=1 Tax=Collinsella stercoris DSM 13279 TaxID=445975 RepID=B6G7N1_9ACTN|nr:16S rRNA (adenine(1518)-N(6)/adenine(1519)-N(6))-dimethyltransferase RsmA [Collinsella stercoris]EEA91728.1 dimethyladenosine transferase [Collinsella stercoris DSM 13279]UEA44973.1 16S rRNA (adenine(1518)-N(6)/adenine(1519)-N(6))-dimethyltransferase RsmA [Collinsella stercoris DSM 13279]UWP12504.1 16S rRNA (adenine(1518)-N(6)/adenine(1519)-N(6))-dimethyltransferase RsmA [Collinsella stercoris]